MSEHYTSISQYGNQILYRGIKNGRQVFLKDQFTPSLFTVSKKPQTEWKSLYGQNLDEVKFGCIKDAKEFLKRYEDVDGFEVHGMESFVYQYINSRFPHDISFSMSDFRIQFLDIETVGTETDGFPNIAEANIPIVMLSLTNNQGKSVLFGLKDFKKTKDDDFEYRLYDDEASLLKGFIQYWQLEYPDIVSGWNTSMFDIPYIVNRIIRILDEEWAKKLSPWNLLRENHVEIRGRRVTTYDIVGVTHIDYLDLYKKFGTYSAKESYALGYIAQEELGETKLDLPGSSFYDAYTNHFDTFVRYNNRDSVLIMKMEKKLKLLELAVTMAYTIKCNIDDVFGTVKPWDVFVYNFLSKQKVAVPPKTRKMAREFEGAYVKEPRHGLRGWILTFDFASLYPTIIRQWNISPETLVREKTLDLTPKKLLEFTPEIQKELESYPYKFDYSIAANGAMYRKDKKGILPQLMEMLMVERKKAKREMLRLEQEFQKTKNPDLEGLIAALNNKQMALKILANSGYGAVTNLAFRYFETLNGEAITLSGQLSDMDIENSMNEFMNKLMKTADVEYAIYLDTDSCYLDVDSLVKKVLPNGTEEEIVKFLDKVGKQIQDTVIKGSIDRLFDRCNCLEKLQDMKREAIASSGFWVGKKKYAMLVHNSEGVDYDPPKQKVMGLEIVRSSTPQKIRKALKECIGIIFEKNQQKLIKFAETKKNEFMSWNLEDVSFPRSVSDVEKYTDKNVIYKKACPIAVRAALLYNHHYKGDISNGDRIRFCYLKMPNPIRENIIGFPADGKFPKELVKYVDKELMWEKGFFDPLKSILTSIGWSLEETSSLEDFF